LLNTLQNNYGTIKKTNYFTYIGIMAYHIKDLLKNYIQQSDNWKLCLLQQWPNIFGNLSTQVTLEKIQEDTIVLGVYDSCWMQELYLLSPLLLKKINATLDSPHITQVRFKKVGRPKQVRTALQHPPKRVSRSVTLSTREQSVLTSIKDPQLRAALEAFLIRCYQEKLR
jgi:hypothetical protein